VGRQPSARYRQPQVKLAWGFDCGRRTWRGGRRGAAQKSDLTRGGGFVYTADCKTL